ncbi:ABC transporter permease subunit [Polycladidibacter hongkongensis]|uniref:ABC transporter permease subunit n=1 Tax=Polycladidibacter hongkongensis TaxID=1647556 RepID=UPI000829D215|nr:ABC transporter permease subunit [Pseudovibrio hongkongensis]
MLRLILKKLGLLIPTFIGVTLTSFFFIRLLPGDPILLLAGERGVSPERYAELQAKFGYDQPIFMQYLDFLAKLFQGDLGVSFSTKQPVVQEFFTLFPATVELAVCAIVFAVLFGLPAGIFAAIRRGKTVDHTVMTTALVGYSMPIFWWGPALIIIFSGFLGWTPVSGRISNMFWIESTTGFMLIDTLFYSDEPGAFMSAVMHLILPTIVLGTIPLAVIARQTRSAMLEVLDEDYVRTARAKGLSSFRIIGIHALRNALIPVVTVIGLQIGVLFAGAILTETVFSWPGIGKWMVDSIFRRDYPVVQGGLLMIAAIIMVVNLIVDLTYGLVNPKIRHTE